MRHDPILLLEVQRKMIQDFFKRYVITPIVELLRQGLTPQMLAISMASGIIIGTFPIVGTTTAICTVVAILFRMNLLVTQLGNWLMYPIEILLIVPFIILGEHLFGTPFTLNTSHFLLMLHTDLWATVQMFSRMIIHATVAWILFALPAFAAVYAILYPVFRHLHARIMRKYPS